MIEIEDKSPKWLKDMIRKTKEEIDSGTEAKCVK